MPVVNDVTCKVTLGTVFGPWRKERREEDSKGAAITCGSLFLQSTGVTCNGHLSLRPLCRASCMLPQRGGRAGEREVHG